MLLVPAGMGNMPTSQNGFNMRFTRVLGILS